jgi:hypothetical protein
MDGECGINQKCYARVVPLLTNQRALDRESGRIGIEHTANRQAIDADIGVTR